MTLKDITELKKIDKVTNYESERFVVDLFVKIYLLRAIKMKEIIQQHDLRSNEDFFRQIIGCLFLSFDDSKFKDRIAQLQNTSHDVNQAVERSLVERSKIIKRNHRDQRMM